MEQEEGEQDEVLIEVKEEEIQERWSGDATLQTLLMIHHSLTVTHR